ncbi:MAG: class I SAM-dependent RNA methyltransferase [Rhodospirillales bacterium]
METGAGGAALEQAGFADPAVAPLVRTAPGTRRRMDFAARRSAAGVLLGLHAAHGRDLVDIDTCLVLHPALTALLAPLRVLLGGLAGLRRQADLVVNLLDSGPDLLIRADAEATTTDRTKLAAFATRHGIGRIAWEAGAAPEIVVQFTPPSVSFGGTRVTPPPGAFLQASPEGEAAIVAAMLAACRAWRRAPRCGAVCRHRHAEFSAGRARDRAGVRGQPRSGRGAAPCRRRHARAGHPPRPGAPAAAGKRTCGRRGAGAGPAVCGGTAADAVDRRGAGAYSDLCQLQSGCVGADAAVLHRAGYEMAVATPIDQFLWSARVEAVCVFRVRKG